MVPTVVSDTTAKLQFLRSEEEWNKMAGRITSFMEEHGIPQTQNRRSRKIKRFMDELSVDEAPTDPIAKLRVDVYFPLLDSLTLQLQDRFPESSLNIVKQMTYFSHEGLMKIAENVEGTLSAVEIHDLCEFYGIDGEEVAEETNVFSQLYKVSYMTINLSDVLSS